MSAESLPEVWLRGPLPGVPQVLQPAAHALLQAREEIHQLLEHFDASKLWDKPVGVASVAFHLQHITGVLDRLMTYALNLPLTEQQLNYLASEGRFDKSITLATLITSLDQKISETVESLGQIKDTIVLEQRTVGRKKLPSTVLGLIFHAAEHTMRHTGQLHVTIKLLQSNLNSS